MTQMFFAYHEKKEGGEGGFEHVCLPRCRQGLSQKGEKGKKEWSPLKSRCKTGGGGGEKGVSLRASLQLKGQACRLLHKKKKKENERGPSVSLVAGGEKRRKGGRGPITFSTEKRRARTNNRGDMGKEISPTRREGGKRGSLLYGFFPKGN